MEKTLEKMTLAFCGTGQHKISAEKFLETEGSVFLDVRAREETDTLRFDFSLFGIETLRIPVDRLPANLEKIPRDKMIACFCSSGTRSAWAYLYLLSQGYRVKWLEASNEELAGLLKPGRIYKKTGQ